jgi:predicted nucleic acid-binding Zn ribbon protein
MFNVTDGPEPLSDILSKLMVVRGYSQAHGHRMLENTWKTVVGEPEVYQTQIGEVRHGVLSVTVAHSVLLEELAAFRKAKLVRCLRSGALGTMIHDIRFRLGSVELHVEDKLA